MPRKPALNAEAETLVRTMRNDGATLSVIAKELGVSSTTVSRSLRSGKAVRKAGEFRNVSTHLAPRTQDGPFVWGLERIRAARDEQIRGRFKLPVQLAVAMRSDSALFTSYLNRIAPHSAIDALLVNHPTERGKALGNIASKSVTVDREVLKGLHGTMVNHGVSVGYIDQKTNDKGTRVDFSLREWPFEHVYWDVSRRMLFTAVENSEAVPIVHGDGFWVVFQKLDDRPWLQEACVLPAALIWASHSNGLADWASASTSHGQSQVMGMMPEGVALQDDDGDLTNEARAFLSMLQDVITGNAGAGLRPFGSETDVLANSSTAWQVFKELIISTEKSAARIYLGTDAILGSVGGAPGVDISELFGIASTIIQGDFAAIEKALNTGVYAPWAAINAGSSKYAPKISYKLPDPDEEAVHDEADKNEKRLAEAVEARRNMGTKITQALIFDLAHKFNVAPVPLLAAKPADAKASLNGAQSLAMLEYVRSVGRGELTPEQAAKMIETSINAPEEVAADIVEDTPAAPPEAK